MNDVTVTRQAALDEQFEVGIFEFSDGTKMYWTAYGRSDDSVFVLADGTVVNEMHESVFNAYIAATENADNIEVNWMNHDEAVRHGELTGIEVDMADEELQDMDTFGEVNAEAFDQSYTSDAWLARQEDGACGVNDDLGESPDF